MKEIILNGGHLLKGMYDAQVSLIMEYQKQGMVPLSDMDINLKDSQRFLKETIANIIEELSEADEVYGKITELLFKPELTNEYLSELLEKYSEELADVMHFMFELMHYSGIEPEDISDYYKALCQEQNLLAIMTSDGLITGMRYGRHLNAFENQQICQAKIVARRLITEAEYEITHVNGFVVHPEVQLYVTAYNWMITKELMMGANFLKNRAWTKGEKPFVNLPQFQRKIMQAFTLMMGMFDLTGWEVKGIYKHYMRKNGKNFERLKNNY